ncbi:MAG: alpha/beta hydrolase family protein [Planctomycetes bacterium]|nr:alpha/beta hydrolase family protein [Planctomycetota bacterium]
MPYDGVMHRYWMTLARETKPALHFTGKTKADVDAWRAKLRAKIAELLGPLPEPAELKPERVGSEQLDGYRREKVVFHAERHMPIPAWVLVPDGIKPGERRPGILACHGHGWDAKDNVCGVDHGNPERRKYIDEARYDYAVQAVKLGYVAIAIDARGWNERGDGSNTPFGGRDKCNVNGNKASLLGYTLMGLNLFDHRRALDYLAQRADVDATRIGSVGLSFGGTMSMWMAALDERIKAAVVSGYLCTWQAFAVELNQFCGSQCCPGFARWGAMSDVAGLIAPRAVLIESGTRDAIFPIAAVREAYAHLQTIYAAAGVPERCRQHVFEGEHNYHGEKTPAFYKEFL